MAVAFTCDLAADESRKATCSVFARNYMLHREFITHTYYNIYMHINMHYKCVL